MVSIHLPFGRRRRGGQRTSESEHSLPQDRRTATRRNRRRRTTVAAATSVLVASFLVINSINGAAAAPSPQQTSSPVQLPRWHLDQVDATLAGRGVSEQRARSLDTVARGGMERIRGKRQPSVLHLVNPVPPSQILKRQDNTSDASARSQSSEQTPSQSTEDPLPYWWGGNHTHHRHLFANTSRNLTAPAAFASSLANSWNPGERSIWFQRKAVIITSIFLAIFIVLIIGCAVFLRAKRDEDLEEEYDVSDEAAVQRMREERDMRQGSRATRRKRRRAADGESIASNGGGRGGGARSTAIVATRWGRLPVRKIRLRRKKSHDSSEEDEKHISRQRSHEDEVDEANPSPSVTNPGSPGSATSQPATRSSPTSEDGSAHDGVRSTDTVATTGEESGSGTVRSAGSGSDAGRSRVPLNNADLAFAEHEEERMRLSDALPPAYIPSQSSQDRSSQGGGVSHDTLHPSSVRPLDGQMASEGLPTAAEEKSRLAAQQEQEMGISREEVFASSSASAPLLHPLVATGGASTAQTGLDGHIATDEKALLSRMRQAASQPDASPLYSATAPASSPPQQEATAPVLEEEEEEEIVGHVDSAAKGKATTSSLLPAPPQPAVQSAFSRFDLPYQLDTPRQTSSNSPPSGSASHEKAREAAEEERQAAALLASRPELPLYEAGGATMATPTAPSAPQWDEDEQDVEIVLAVERQTASTPSAPPLPLSDDPEHKKADV